MAQCMNFGHVASSAAYAVMTAVVRTGTFAALVSCVACGSDDPESKQGSSGQAGSMASGGSASGSGGASSGGTSAAAGAMSTGGATGTGGSMGTQPLGKICANDGNCSQAEGAAVCCVNTCTLSEQCPTSTGYLPCESTADCSAYGGGKQCCELEAGGQTMRFCTKQSACAGQILP